MGKTYCKKKVGYIRHSNLRWTLNGSLNPPREFLIAHLKNEHNLSADLDSLSYDELLAIHDDDHNNSFVGLDYK